MSTRKRRGIDTNSNPSELRKSAAYTSAEDIHIESEEEHYITNEEAKELLEENDALKSKIAESAKQIMNAHYNEDGTAVVGPLRLYSVGLQIDGDIDEDAWLGYLASAQKIKSAYQWILADLLYYGLERKYGETADQVERISEITGLSTNALNDYAWVAGSVEISSREENLSFAHHKLVAKFSPEEQRIKLAFALKHNLSTRKLEAHLKGHEVINPTPLDVSRKRFHSFKKSQIKLAKEMSVDERQTLARDLRALAKEIEKLED